MLLSVRWGFSSRYFATMSFVLVRGSRCSSVLLGRHLRRVALLASVPMRPGDPVSRS